MLNKKKITLNKGLINNFPLFSGGVSWWLGGGTRGGTGLFSLIEHTGLVEFIFGLGLVLVIVGWVAEWILK